MMLLILATAYSQIGYYVWDPTCFTSFLTGTGTITAAFPAAGSPAANLDTFTFSQSFASVPTCINAITALQMTTSATAFDFLVKSVAPCTTTTITLAGSMGTQTTISVVRVSWLANLFAPLIVGSMSQTSATLVSSLSFSIATSLTSANGATGDYFLVGYFGQRCSSPPGQCKYQGPGYNNLNFGAGSATVSISGRNSSLVSRIDINYIMYETNTLSNTTNSYRLAKYVECGANTVNAGSTQNCNPGGFPTSYLANNVMFGLSGFRFYIDITTKFSVQITYSSSPYNYLVSQISGTTQFSDVNVGFFILYEKACPAATFPSALYLSVNRASCLAACGVSEFFDTCKHCFACHITCYTCQNDLITDCLSCSAANFRTAGGAFAPANTCICTTGYVQNSPLTAACAACHYTCTTCSTPGNSNTCVTCDGVTRTLSGTTCPCSTNYLNVAGVCQPCGPNCVTCVTVVANCVSCTAGNWLNAAYPHTCDAACLAGQFQSTTPQICSFCTSFCATCVTASSNCLTCVASKFFYLNTCINPCPNGFYADSATQSCLSCDPNCPTCSSFTVCLTCVNPLYLLNGACLTTCPTGYFGRQLPGSWVCLSCQGNCVQVVDFSLYPLDINSYPATPLVAHINFTYPVVGFNLYYVLNVPFGYTAVVDVSSDQLNYTITIYPTSQIAFGVVTLKSVSYTSTVMGQFNTPMYSDVWNKVATFNYSYLYGSLGEGSKALGRAAEAVFNLSIPPQARILLGLGLPSLQLTSCLLLTDYPLPKHFYDGLRVISLGNYYYVPPWELTPNNRSVLGIDNITNLNHSRLLGDLSVPSRLYRTTFSSYFVFNVYIQIAVLLVGVLLNLLAQRLHAAGLVGKSWAAAGWVLCDYLHQYFIMYLYLSSMVVVQSFSKEGPVSVVSLVLCLLINFWFLGYHLYRFYDFSYLKVSSFGSKQFQEFSIKFGHMVRYIKYSQSQQFHPLVAPWASPQYYHFFSPLKKSIMMLAFALFAEHFQAQLGAVALFQLLQIIRFSFLWPFTSTARNVSRLLVEIMMGSVMILTLVVGFQFKQVQAGDINALQLYNILGWLLVVFCYVFNIYHLTVVIWGCYDRLTKGDSQMLMQSRKEYFYKQVKKYAQAFQQINARDFYDYVRKGNLNERDQSSLPVIDVRIEEVKILRVGQKLGISVNRCLELKMNSEGSDFKAQNNTVQTKKLNKTRSLSSIQSEELKEVAARLLGDNQQFQVKTFMRVEQSKYQFGAVIPLAPSFQEVKVTGGDGREQTKRLEKDEMLMYFPLPRQALQAIAQQKGR